MTLMWVSMVVMLLMGFPFMVLILGSLMLQLEVNMPMFNMNVIVQQVLTGLTPPALQAVPMFILGAAILTSGKAARRLINMVRVLVGHVPGGLPITTNASCTLFGAVPTLLISEYTNT